MERTARLGRSDIWFPSDVLGELSGVVSVGWRRRDVRTMWIPFGDVGVERGTIALSELDAAGWTTDSGAGEVALFGLTTVHAAPVNLLAELRRT